MASEVLLKMLNVMLQDSVPQGQTLNHPFLHRSSVASVKRCAVETF